MVQKILRCEDVQRATGLPRSTLYHHVAAGQFPRPIPIGARAVGWLEEDVLKWQQERIAARDGRAA